MVGGGRQGKEITYIQILLKKREQKKFPFIIICHLRGKTLHGEGQKAFPEKRKNEFGCNENMLFCQIMKISFSTSRLCDERLFRAFSAVSFGLLELRLRLSFSLFSLLIKSSEMRMRLSRPEKHSAIKTKRKLMSGGQSFDWSSASPWREYYSLGERKPFNTLLGSVCFCASQN